MAVALFDLDGTLTDPKVGITAAVAVGLAAVGIVVDDLDTLTPYIGPPLQDSFPALAGLDGERTAIAIGAYREYFAERGLFENEPYPGVAEMLQRLLAGGWRLAIATSKPTVFAERILDHFDLRTPFEVVAGAKLDGSRRHKRDIIAHALDLVGHPPLGACVMVGDREHDVFGARQLGIATVGVTWGYGSVEELLAAGAALLVDRPADVPAALVALARPASGPGGASVA